VIDLSNFKILGTTKCININAYFDTENLVKIIPLLKSNDALTHLTLNEIPMDNEAFS
jgi:hypothetical protein